MFKTLKLHLGKEITLKTVINALLDLGYKRHKMVTSPGDFSVRGDILEVFPVNFSFPLRCEWEFSKINQIYSIDKVNNEKIVNYDFVILIPFSGRSRRHYSPDFPLNAILKIKKGDYVVHNKYGIGKFLQFKKMKLPRRQGYFFQLEYAGGDLLYVSEKDAHMLQKYTDLAGRTPKLTRLGSNQWRRIKHKVNQGIKSFAFNLLRDQAQRNLAGGIKYPADGKWQKIFEDNFPYPETPDQQKAIADTKKDMESSRCMDRLICGDVGYGKTEVAMRAAFKAVMGGKQVAFLVPTTILAYQHYTNFCRRIGDFPLKVEMLSRFKTKTQQKQIVKALRQGKVDIIIGTHRLLSGDVRFADLGLLIVDEEHRFGVKHKEKIKQMRSGIDVLTLTATPIPRTLYMGLIDIKQISVIKTPPRQRKAVKTNIMEFDARRLSNIIKDELKRKGQVFFVHNRIHNIDYIYKRIKSYLSQAKIAVVHGRLPANEIEDIMLKFIDAKIDCLLSTAIVESGIDIPKANTIIINDAHKFGLSDLHQLRGRVGRFHRQSYAYLVIPPREKINTAARKRLRLVKQFSYLGSGFDLAMGDLELRGAGNILGPQQHGFVWMVGFDLYCRLLRQEIERLKEVFAKL